MSAATRVRRRVLRRWRPIVVQLAVLSVPIVVVSALGARLDELTRVLTVITSSIAVWTTVYYGCQSE